MPYEYYCLHCQVISTRYGRRADADAEMAEHRRTEHGGLAPIAGDGVDRVHSTARGDGILPNGSCLFVLFLLALVLADCWGR